MPTYMGTRYALTYDLGDATQRGVTQQFSHLKRGLRAVFGRGVPDMQRETTDGRARVAVDIILSKHPLMLKSGGRVFRTEDHAAVLGQLEQIAGYVGREERRIMHWT